MGPLNHYSTDGRGILYDHCRADRAAERCGVLTVSPEQRGEMLDLLNRAAHANDRRHYTESARLYHVASLGVAWDGDETLAPDPAPISSPFTRRALAGALPSKVLR